ncbi:MAG: hypothetical protein PVF05_03180 [Gemmatimonadales bacterium]|jgi:hypothetical protein
MDVKRLVFVVLGIVVALVLVSTVFVIARRDASDAGGQLGARALPVTHVARATGA